jgi:exodeoxyribonuclease III
LCGRRHDRPRLMRMSLDSSKETQIRLVTWNCCRGSYDIKLSRLQRLTPDIAVLQECGRPPQEDATVSWFGFNPRQGVAISARAPFRVIAEPIRAGSQSLFAARVRGPVTFTLVAVWAQQEPTYIEALQRGLTLYRDVLLAGPCVLMGDLNSSVAWDTRHGRTDHRDFEARLHREFGLVSAYHAAMGEEPGHESKPTHFWRWREASPFHLDYCYLPETWLPGLTSVTVGSYDEWADASDHRPVTVEVIPPAEFARAAV